MNVYLLKSAATCEGRVWPTKQRRSCLTSLRGEIDLGNLENAKERANKTCPWHRTSTTEILRDYMYARIHQKNHPQCISPTTGAWIFSLRYWIGPITSDSLDPSNTLWWDRDTYNSMIGEPTQIHVERKGTSLQFAVTSCSQCDTGLWSVPPFYYYLVLYNNIIHLPGEKERKICWHPRWSSLKSYYQWVGHW